jgi:hypothetical protein
MKLAAAILGGAVGGAAGYWLFFWMASQGFYALALPGAALGLGAGYARCGHRWLAYAAGFAGLLLGLLAEWRFAPFKADDGCWYFLTHVHDLKPLTLAMVAVGAVSAFWFVRER